MEVRTELLAINKEASVNIDTIAQIGIAFCGVPALFLVARKNKWGFVFGLSAQPFWYITTYTHKQWWVMALCAVYTGNWAYGAYTWFKNPPITERSSS